MTTTIIISRKGAGDAAQVATEQAVAGACATLAGAHVLLVPDLYHLHDADPLWEQLAALTGPLVVVSWLYPRPMTWLLHRHGVGQGRATALHLGSYDTPAACLTAIREAAGLSAEATGEATVQMLNGETAQRWYPVMDLSRCSNCHHCLQFCLFGTYSEDAAGHVTVTDPDRCKPGCPACSRICPQGAIIFPIYSKDDAIAGAPGRFMTPDLAARKMYYTRTQRPCPVCGGVATPEALRAGGGTPCQECGLAVKSAAKPTPEGLEDLDALIDELDGLATRGR